MGEDGHTQWVELIEAARILGVSYHTAHRWALQGRLKSKRAAGRWFVDQGSVIKVAGELRRAEAGGPSADRAV